MGDRKQQFFKPPKFISPLNSQVNVPSQVPTSIINEPNVVDPIVPRSSPNLSESPPLQQSHTSQSLPSVIYASLNQNPYFPCILLPPQFTNADILLSQSPSRVDRPIDAFLFMGTRSESSSMIHGLRRETGNTDIRNPYHRYHVDHGAMFANASRNVRSSCYTRHPTSSLPGRLTQSDTNLLRREVVTGPCGPAPDIDVHPSGARSVPHLPTTYSPSLVKVLNDLRKEMTIYMILIHRTNNDLLEYWAQQQQRSDCPSNF